MRPPGLIGRSYSRHIGGHVGKNKVNGSSIKRLLKPLQHRVFAEITPNKVNIGYRLHIQDIQSNDFTPGAD